MNTNGKMYCNCGVGFRKKHHYENHKRQCEMDKQRHKTYLRQFIKTSFENIEYINGVPKVVFVCWFGITNNEFPKMSENRFNAFKTLVENIGVPIILITSENYKYFIKKNYPLHNTFNYLSGVHKSDYFRCYLLLHYGGGYHDIKFRKDSWKDCWTKDNWLNDENIWLYGRREKYEGAIAYPPNKNMQHIQKEYAKLVTMGWIICKPQTLFLKDLFDQIEFILTKHESNLQKFPAVNARQMNGGTSNNNYPIRWLEILGEIFHPLMIKYNQHIKFGLPDAFKKSYK